MAFNGKMSGKSELSTFSGSLYLNIPKWWATGDLFRRASKEIPKKENFEVTFEASQDQIIYIVKRKKGNQPTGSKPSRPKIKPKKEVVPEKV